MPGELQSEQGLVHETQRLPYIVKSVLHLVQVVVEVQVWQLEGQEEQPLPEGMKPDLQVVQEEPEEQVRQFEGQEMHDDPVK